MVQIVFIWTGPTRSRPLRQVIDDYIYRIRRWVPCEIREGRSPRFRDPHQQAAQLRAEARWILEQTTGLDDWIALSPRGEVWTPPDWTRWWRVCVHRGQRVGLVLGGPYGLAPSVEQAAPHRVSLGPIVLSHEMARAVIVEWIYRLLSLWKGVPYAK